jgi:hypothetical protein
MERHQQIQQDGYIKPSTGNTYADKVFLSDNDRDARLVAFIKHAKTQGETIVVYKIHRDALRRKLITNGSSHTAMNIHGKTYCYADRIDITHPRVFVGSAPYTLNLPEGVEIVRDGKTTGLSFSGSAFEQYFGDAE